VLGRSPNNIGVTGQSHAAAGVAGNSTNGPGVSGDSINDAGVIGRSQAIGVLGEGKNKAGVYGQSDTGVGVRGQSQTGTGVYGAVADPNGLAGRFKGRVLIDGDLTVTGAKGAVVPHPDGRHRLLCAIESPESWFEDFGEATLHGGLAEVELDAEFAQVVLTDRYHVFLTPYGPCDGLYVERRGPHSFVVRDRDDKTSVPFSYRVVARRKDIDVPRFKTIDTPAAGDEVSEAPGEPGKEGVPAEPQPRQAESITAPSRIESVITPRPRTGEARSSRRALSIEKPKVAQRLKRE
jgi:hypothetical protein